jgi:hypothetical protein
MRADVTLSEDTTTLYVRWEGVAEGSEPRRLERLGGPLVLRIGTSHYVDEGGKYHEQIDVDVPIFPHPGERNRGQAKFRDHDALRRFVESLQEGVGRDVADFLWDGDLQAVPVEGHVVHRPEVSPAP